MSRAGILATQFVSVPVRDELGNDTGTTRQVPDLRMSAAIHEKFRRLGVINGLECGIFTHNGHSLLMAWLGNWALLGKQMFYIVASDSTVVGALLQRFDPAQNEIFSMQRAARSTQFRDFVKADPNRLAFFQSLVRRDSDGQPIGFRIGWCLAGQNPDPVGVDDTALAEGDSVTEEAV